MAVCQAIKLLAQREKQCIAIEFENVKAACKMDGWQRRRRRLQ